MKQKNRLFWIIWFITSGLLSFSFIQTLNSEDKTLFLPGETSNGHHQIEQRCDLCHGESFSDAEVMQKKCLSCHKQELKLADDSHPKAKFTDPRNANLIEILDARYCVSCHLEHKTELTLEMGVTQPDGFCINCHAEIGEDRASHQGMNFKTCASAGCHNYHDNRALYEDFLLKHAHEDDLKSEFSLPAIDKTALYQDVIQHKTALTLEDQDADSEELQIDDRILHDWAGSQHAKAGVNCSQCHLDKTTEQWLAKPGYTACQSCHKLETNGFLNGKHGMRLKAELPAMKPVQAKAQLNSNKNMHDLGCASCHQDHEFDREYAAIEACSQCHDDDHSRNYKKSMHFKVWLAAENRNERQSTGVTCASCHMPIEEQKSNFFQAITVQHNQNANLRPNEKMLRSVCLNCHSLEFSIDALADPELIRNNFSSQPGLHIESIGMALARDKK